MKQFRTILKFELDNYFKSKSYVIATILLALLAVGVMFVPRVTNIFKDDNNDKIEINDNNDVDEDSLDKVAIYDKTGSFEESSYRTIFTDKKPVMCNSVDELKELVNDENSEYECGYVINSITDFEYYVYNKTMFDTGRADFEEYMRLLIKVDYCKAHNLDVNDFLEIDYKEITSEETILGKNAQEGYGYSYALVIIIFMLIVMYGTSIASGVTNEKSNRSIEILVTSTSSTAILFGKVIAGAIASVLQSTLILGGAIASYQFNKSYWGNDILDMFLNIPANVLITFFIFGLGGFLLYAFLYGALGALVSKIEDLNKSAGTAQMLVMIVYFVVLMNLTNVNGVVIKVCSFIPLSSYSAMFARVGMGDVALWEVVVSAVLLYASVILMGILGGKIFRSSTLRYGNPIKFSSAIKKLKSDKADR